MRPCRLAERNHSPGKENGAVRTRRCRVLPCTPYMKIKQQRQISHNTNYVFKTVPRSAHEAAPARRMYSVHCREQGRLSVWHRVINNAPLARLGRNKDGVLYHSYNVLYSVQRSWYHSVDPPGANELISRPIWDLVACLCASPRPSTCIQYLALQDLQDHRRH